MIDLEYLKKEFRVIEILRFNIVSNYVTGMVNASDIEEFKEKFFRFREHLYDFATNEENILEVAEMKSQLQHYNTEVLEDEDLLRVAYSNSC
mgnify:CR=1 FL=1